MGTLLEIIKAVISLFGFFEKLFSLFKKAPSEAEKDKIQEGRDEVDHFKKTGRPQK